MTRKGNKLIYVTLVWAYIHACMHVVPSKCIYMPLIIGTVCSIIVVTDTIIGANRPETPGTVPDLERLSRVRTESRYVQTFTDRKYRGDESRGRVWIFALG